MKNLKRTLSLVLAVALCFSLLTMGASAKVYKDESSVTYKEAVQWLSTLGIMGGELNSDGTYSLRPTDPITRAEFSKLVCFVMSGGKDPSLGSVTETSFSDTKGHWAASYIEFLVSLGYVSGYGDGTFGPNDTITGQQAAKILLTVLGYNATQEKLTGTGWAFKVDSLANINGLYAELNSTFVTSNLLKREEAAQIIWNACKQYIVSYDDNGNLGSKVVRSTTETLLSMYFDVELTEGVLVANSYGNITDEGKNPTADKMTIRPFKKADGTQPADLVFDKDTSTYSMLGESVRLAYMESTVNGSKTKKLIGDIATTDYNKSFISEAGGKVKEATVGQSFDVKITPATTTPVVAAYMTDYTTKIVLNGVVQSATYAATWLGHDDPSNYDYCKTGYSWTTQFIDNDGDGDTDFIKAYAYTPYKVTDITSGGVATLKDLTGVATTFTWDTAKMLNRGTQTKATIAEKDIIAGVIINDKLYVEPTTSFTGKVNGTAALQPTGAAWSVTVDGTTYKIHDVTVGSDGSGSGAEDKVRTGKITLDTTATFYKDSYGYICYIDEDTTVAADNVKFAVVTVADGYNMANDGEYLKLVLADGTEVVKLATTLYDGDSFEDVDSSNKIAGTTLPIVIAYTEKTDGSLKVLPISNAATLLPTATPLKIDNDTPKILKVSDSLAYSSYFTSSATVFVNAEDNLTYTSYAKVPDVVFTTAATSVNAYTFILTQDVVYAAQTKLNGGSKTGSSDYVLYMFYAGADTKATGDDVYFYIPNVGAKSISFASDGSTKLYTYSAYVNGVKKNYTLTAALADKSGSEIKAKTLYVVDKYDSDGTSVSAVTLKADLNTSSAAASKVKFYDGDSLQTADASYILTSSTAYINVAALPGISELVDYDYLDDTKYQYVYVTYDADTLEALQVYFVYSATTDRPVA